MGMAIDSVSTPPYRAYAAITSSFLGAVALISLGTRRNAVARYTSFDAVVLSLATFKAARTLAHDDVASFLREPFVEGMPADSKGERPVPTGNIRQAIGELVTCTRCVGTWAAVGLVATEALMPSFGRVLIRSLALGGANDWLQAGFSALTTRRTP